MHISVGIPKIEALIKVWETRYQELGVIRVEIKADFGVVYGPWESDNFHLVQAIT